MGYRHLTLREALASDRLEDFVRQEEARGVELANGSDLERALALLITQRQSEDRSFTAAGSEKVTPGQSRRALFALSNAKKTDNAQPTISRIETEKSPNR